MKLDIPGDRVNEAKQRVKAAYTSHEPDQLPVDFRPHGFDWSRISVKRRMLDQEAALAERIAFINFQYEAFPDNDFIPCLDVNTGEIVMPSIFGVEYFYPENDMPWCLKKPVINDLKEDIQRFRDINSKKAPLVQHVLERIDYFLAKMKQKLPVTYCDMGSPLVIASKMMKTDQLFFHMYDQPELMRELLDVIAEKMIEVMNLQLQRVGNPDLLQPVLNTYVINGGKGVLYDDFIGFISPKMYRNICKAANEKVLKAMGGGHFHSCGPVLEHLDEIITMQECKSFDFVFLCDSSKTTQDLLKVKEKCQGRISFLSRSMPNFTEKREDSFSTQGDITLSDEENITPEWIAKMNKGGGFLIRATGSIEWGQQLQKMIHQAKRREWL